METSFPISVLIAAPEGVLGSALRTFLETLPGVRVVARPSSQAAALQELAHHLPMLLLLDCELSSSGEKTLVPLPIFLDQIRRLVPGIATIAIANDLQQKEMALKAGATQVILRGTFDQPLQQAVERMSLSIRPEDPISVSAVGS